MFRPFISLNQIAIGDLVLYVNSHMLMIDKTQARNSYEYIQALRDTISTASVPSLFGPSPRAIRCVCVFVCR